MTCETYWKDVLFTHYCGFEPGHAGDHNCGEPGCVSRLIVPESPDMPSGKDEK